MIRLVNAAETELYLNSQPSCVDSTVPPGDLLLRHNDCELASSSRKRGNNQIMCVMPAYFAIPSTIHEGSVGIFDFTDVDCPLMTMELENGCVLKFTGKYVASSTKFISVNLSTSSNNKIKPTCELTDRLLIFGHVSMQ